MGPVIPIYIVSGFASGSDGKESACSAENLGFTFGPIPAGAQGPAGLQSARSRAGPDGQSSVFCPLDFQRTPGCLEKPRRLRFFSRGVER